HCLHQLLGRLTGCQQGRSNAVTLGLRLCCENSAVSWLRDISTTRQDIANNSFPVFLRQLAPIIEPKARPLQHKKSFVRSSDSRHPERREHAVHWRTARLPSFRKREQRIRRCRRIGSHFFTV